MKPGLSPAQRRALEILERCPGIHPREFSQAMWPDALGHSRIANVGHGATRGVGMWRTGGCYLAKLAKLDFVHRSWHMTFDNRYWDDGYRLTGAGEQALRFVREAE